MVNIEISHDPAILLLAIYPRTEKVYPDKNLYTNVHSNIVTTGKDGNDYNIHQLKTG